MKEKQQLFIEAILLKDFPIISLSSVYHSKMVSIPFFLCGSKSQFDAWSNQPY